MAEITKYFLKHKTFFEHNHWCATGGSHTSHHEYYRLLRLAET